MEARAGGKSGEEVTSPARGLRRKAASALPGAHTIMEIKEEERKR
jgi:hypothetical protein